MPEHENHEPTHNPKKSRKSGLPLLVVIILLAAAGAGLFLFSRHEKIVPEEHVTTLMTQQAQQDSAAKPSQPEMGGEPESLPSEQLHSNTENKPIQELTGGCSILARKLHEFFRHVDQQEYLARFPLNGPAQAYFISLAQRLLDNPPVVSRESDDLYTILQNMAHFFRIIGKENILLIKTILDREQDMIEDTAGNIFQWLVTEGCQEELLPFTPPLAQVYEYAGFFLNTMGGRSYLFRRDSRSRLLVNYYSVLIVDRANAMGLNRHGIDLNQILPQLIQEIETSNQLISKENYLARLYKLQDSLTREAAPALDGN